MPKVALILQCLDQAPYAVEKLDVAKAAARGARRIKVRPRLRHLAKR